MGKVMMRIRPVVSANYPRRICDPRYHGLIMVDRNLIWRSPGLNFVVNTVRSDPNTPDSPRFTVCTVRYASSYQPEDSKCPGGTPEKAAGNDNVTNC